MVSGNDLILQQGIQSVMSYHSNSISKALADLFPDIGLDRSKFKEHKCMLFILFIHHLLTKYSSFFLSSTHLSFVDEWITVENRRAFFMRYAQSNGFDALVASNWYSQPLSKIVNTKVCSSTHQSLPNLT